ncbi:uncharacterized protein LOC125228664 [Leguminivora glycinivorella]|uniref:uncharacterized protein LOC125228664 n=1 Tax=Leguminivora glycinivorella TaxID=1035111 RepID=UPI00200C1102|nr:uncharacterized protein LOC125228664 [Leguminivora glycinivorella]
MKQIDNKNLNTLKCVLFCFLAGVGCIFPFLPLHMTEAGAGLSRGEARLISAVAPCVALLGPAILGHLIDKLSIGRGSTSGGGPSGSGRLLRVVTAICLILGAIFYTLLLAVPYTNRGNAPRPIVWFSCDENGAYVTQDKCSEGTTEVPLRFLQRALKRNSRGVLALGLCEYGCGDANMTWVRTVYPTTPAPLNIPNMWNKYFNFTVSAWRFRRRRLRHPRAPPAPCIDGQCHVYMHYKSRMLVPMAIQPYDQLYDDNSTKYCSYRVGGASCSVPPGRVPDSEDCIPTVRCQVLDPYDEKDSVMGHAECKVYTGDPTATFWSYFVIRILSDIWPTAALALLGTACVIATRETSIGRGDVGRQLAVGTIGLAIFPPIAGVASDAMPENPFLVPFLMHAVFMLIGAAILLLDSHMPLSTPEWWWHTSTGMLALPMNAVRRYGAETAAIFAVVTLLGVLWSGIDSYLPWTVKDLNGTETEMGLTVTIGALPAIPALWWAEALVDYVGHSNIFITAFTFYCLRYTGLAYSTDYTWIAVIEALEVFTMSLVWVTAVLYFRHLVPRKYTATGQALPVIAHFCIGRCIGAIVGGLVTMSAPLESARSLYRALGVAALLAAAVYLALYHLLLAPRCAAPQAPPPTHLLQGLNTNGGSNGTYSPTRVYHEERSRKGHFRY